MRKMPSPPAWAEIVGPQIAAVTHVEELVGNVLYVAADSPDWAAELHAMSPKIVAKFHAAGLTELESIRWVGLAPRLVPSA